MSRVTETTVEASGSQQKQPDIGLSVVLKMEDLKELTKQSSVPTMLWDRIRNELRLSTRDFYTPRKATLAWARKRGNAKSGRAVLVSFYNEELDECIDQLSFKARGQSRNSVLITHWPYSAKGLKPEKKYFSNASRENGFEPDKFTPKELIDKFVQAFMEQSEIENGQSCEEILCERFFGSFHPPLIANSDEDRDKPAVIYLNNVIETDDEETRVHIFTYKRKLDFFRRDYAIFDRIGKVRVFMHWGVVFKFEKPTGSVYWTLDGGRKKGRFGVSGDYIVRAHRALPDDIDAELIEGDNKEEKLPLVEYHGFVNSSRRDMIRIAKQLQLEHFADRYRLRTKNCQVWVSELLIGIANKYDRFWYGPKTLESKYFDKFGKKMKTKKRNNKRKKKTTTDKVAIKLFGGRNDVTKPFEVSRGNTDNAEKYKELLEEIQNNYDIENDKFEERRKAKLYKLGDGENTKVLVRFVKQEEHTIEESYLIHSQADSLSFTRFSTDLGLVPPPGEDCDVKAGLSVRSMFRWCVEMHGWLVVSGKKNGHEYSSKRFADKFIRSQGPLTLSKTLNDVTNFFWLLFILLISILVIFLTLRYTTGL